MEDGQIFLKTSAPLLLINIFRIRPLFVKAISLYSTFNMEESEPDIKCEGTIRNLFVKISRTAQKIREMLTAENAPMICLWTTIHRRRFGGGGVFHSSFLYHICTDCSVSFPGSQVHRKKQTYINWQLDLLNIAHICKRLRSQGIDSKE
jgi:hypothetical protein